MKTRPAIERFEEKIERIPFSGCWIWLGASGNRGYGQMRDGTHTGTVGTHRFAYRHFVGQIPDGLLVCHRCDVRCCVNPDHLFLGTAKDNAADMHRKGRCGNKPKTHCKHGHAFSQENTLVFKGMRQCKTCARNRTRDYKRRIRATHCLPA